jgi:WD40 repeat protein
VDLVLFYFIKIKINQLFILNKIFLIILTDGVFFYIHILALAWHPIHERLFSSGGSDGSIYFWHVGYDSYFENYIRIVKLLFFSRTEKELAGMDDAHEGMIWDMSWHPLGHMLVSGSNDHTTFVFILFFI